MCILRPHTTERINTGFKIAFGFVGAVQLDTVAGDGEFRFFRLAQSIDQQAHTKDHNNNGENQLVPDIKFPDVQVVDQEISAKQRAAYTEKGEIGKQAK